MANIGCINYGLLRPKMANTSKHICTWLSAFTYIYNVPPRACLPISFIAFNNVLRLPLPFLSRSPCRPCLLFPSAPSLMLPSSSSFRCRRQLRLHLRPRSLLLFPLLPHPLPPHSLPPLPLQSSLVTGPTTVWTDPITAARRQISCSTSWLCRRCSVSWSTLLSSSHG